MRENCECSYCKEKVDEYCCISCGYNFNECESVKKSKECYFCPKCVPIIRERVWVSKKDMLDQFPEKPEKSTIQ
jgi:hypothetical protein